MAITRTYLGTTVSDDVPTTTIQVTVDSTGYNHIGLFIKHEGSPTTITLSDNKGTATFNGLTKVNHSNGDMSGQVHWFKTGTPGSSHTITATLGAAKPYRRLAVWGINAGTGDIALDVESTAEGSGTSVDAGSLATTAATISIMGVGDYTSNTYTAGSGWTGDYTTDFLAQSRSDASGTLDPVCTMGSSADWVACSASFKEAGGAAHRAQVSWAEFEVPNVPHRAQVSWAELEVPNVPHRAQVSWAEFEVPNEPRRSQVSWAELEVPNVPHRAQVSWAELEVPNQPHRAQVSWAELEVPNLAERRGQVSWSELEVPNSPARGQVSWAELEVPNVPHRAQVSWAEFEVPDYVVRRLWVSWIELEVPGDPPATPHDNNITGGLLELTGGCLN